jgi:hypothetical protein
MQFKIFVNQKTLKFILHESSARDSHFVAVRDTETYNRRLFVLGNFPPQETTMISIYWQDHQDVLHEGACSHFFRLKLQNKTFKSELN